MVHDEVRNLSAVKHKFIVEFYRAEECCNTFLIFMEYMEGVRNLSYSPTAIFFILYMRFFASEALVFFRVDLYTIAIIGYFLGN